jgi:hypothetical protein
MGTGSLFPVLKRLEREDNHTSSWCDAELIKYRVKGKVVLVLN